MRASTRLFFEVGIGFAIGCGCSGSDAAAPDAGVSTGDDAYDSGPDPVPTCSAICGASDITVVVAQAGSPSNVPLADASVRASISETEFLDAKTDGMGVAHLKLDVSKGPFDITVALSGFTAVSVLGVTASIPGNIVLTPLSSPPTVQQFSLTGSITGVNPLNRLQVAGYGVQTAVTTRGDAQYATTYSAAAGSMVGVGLTAIEVDDSMPFGIAVNGYAVPVATAVAGPMAIPIAMPLPPVAAHASSITINWPSAGIFTGADIKGSGVPGHDALLQPGFVEQWQAATIDAHRAVGLASIDAPMNGSSLFHLQTFPGAMAPDVAGIEVTTVAPMGTPSASDYAAIVYAHSLVDGTAVDVGKVDAITVNGTTLGDATFRVSSTGYDGETILISSVAGTTSTPIWILYAPGPGTATRALPYLPGGVMLGDLGGDVSVATIEARAVKYIKNAASPWQSIVQDRSHMIGNAMPLSLEPTGR